MVSIRSGQLEDLNSHRRNDDNGDYGTLRPDDPASGDSEYV